MILSLIFAILNALRGSGFWKNDPAKLIDYLLSRPFWMVLMTCATVVYANYHHYSISALIYISVVMLTFLEIGFCLGWGKYLNIAYPKMIYAAEDEVKIIDWITTKLYRQPVTEKEFSNWCFIAFFFRSMLFYPLFAALSFYNIHALYYGTAVVLMPVIYWCRHFVPAKYSVRCAEFIFGGLLGLLITLSV